MSTELSSDTREMRTEVPRDGDGGDGDNRHDIESQANGPQTSDANNDNATNNSQSSQPDTLSPPLTAHSMSGSDVSVLVREALMQPLRKCRNARFFKKSPEGPSTTRVSPTYIVAL